MWLIWKNRNFLFFEGKRSWPVDTFNRIKKESYNWFLAQIVDSNITQEASKKKELRAVWKSPPTDWVKCNVGCSWSKENHTCGGAWVMSDSQGIVLMHSRRSFSCIPSRDEAKLKCLIWALNSMKDHHMNKVIFASKDHDILGAILRPRASPSFTFQVAALNNILSSFNDWRVHIEEMTMNRGTQLIAQSVTRDDRRQSYVFIGSPLWLKEFFVGESVLSSN